MFDNMFKKVYNPQAQSTGNSYFKTILGPTSVDLIFYTPKVANLGFWKIVPRIAL